MSNRTITNRTRAILVCLGSFLCACALVTPDFDLYGQNRIAITFSHAAHMDAPALGETADCLACHDDHRRGRREQLDCRDCHEGDLDQADALYMRTTRMSDCVSCHEEKQVDDGGCLGCHKDIDETTAPRNHTLNWGRTSAHGMASDFADSCQDANLECSLCHTEASCADCHQRTEPVSHTSSWSRRGHGFAAQMNPQNCATCHKEDSCIACHQTAEPTSHRSAIFGGRSSSHCVNCHLPLDPSDGCGVCHPNTRSHQQAQPVPPLHPQGDCRSCHFPLNHFENGQDCRFCHS